MNSPVLSRLRRARWVHALQLLVFSFWVLNPFPGAFSYWTDSNGDRVKEEVADPPEGDSWFDQDSDGDGLTNAQEALFGSDPYQIDSDFDGLTDQVERDYADPTAPYDPWNWDSDGDGYSDHDEFYQRLWGYSPQVNYNSLTPGSFYSYADADGDGEKNPDDSDPLNFDRDWDGTVNWLDGSPMFNGVGGQWMDDTNNGVWTDPGVYIGGTWYPSGTMDSDMDGTPDHLDVYPWGSYTYNGMEYEGSWQDSDGDGVPDVADSWPYDSLNGNVSPEGYDYNGTWYYGTWQDNDGDGIPDPADAYPYDPANGGFDYNGTWYFGPWLDNDSDGIPDPADAWPYDPLNGAYQEGYNYNGTWYSGFWQDSDSDGIPDPADSHPYDSTNGAYQEGYDYNGTWYYGTWQDSDADGIPDPADAWPYDSYNGTWTEPDSDGDGFPDSTDAYPYDATNGANYYYNGSMYYGYWTDSDLDGAPDPADSHSSDPALWDDFDSDGRNAANDSHPDTGGLWNDWNFDGDNHDTDGDEDGTPDVRDSHPRESWRWADWDNDGSNDPSGLDHDNDSRLNEDDSHPADGTLWSDWNFNGTNNDSDGDEDGHADDDDSHPHDASLWSDWNFDGTNNDSDGDEDGHPDAEDSHPHHAGLHSDWNGDGDDNDTDWDEDGVENGQDTSPKNAALWDDQDGDGHNAESDSHPQTPALWSDWNGNGTNHDTDGDEDGWADGSDSHPREAQLWNDFDGDGHNADHDSHPADASLWSDWDGNGQNNDTDWDEDSHPNADDSDPYIAMLWSDWDRNGINHDSDGDEDGTEDGLDSHPRDSSLQSDWNFNGQNDGPGDDSDGDGRPNATDSDPLNATLWSDWNHDGTNHATDGDEDGVLNDEDSHPFDPALSTDWNFDGDDNAEDMDEDGWANLQLSPEGLPVEGSDSHPRDPLLWSDWDGNGTNNDEDWDEDGILNANDSHPRHAVLWSDWDFNQVNNDQDGDEDGVLDTQDSDPRNNALSSDWNHDGTDNPSDWDEDGHDNGNDSHPANANLWDDFDGDGVNAENDSHPADGSLHSDWNHDGDNHATDGDEDGAPDLNDSHPRNPTLWVDWNFDGYNDGDEPPDDDNDGIPNNQDNFPDDPYNDADSDLDGLKDYDEVTTHGMDRLDVDSDDDFLSDYEELLVTHTNPTAAKSNPVQSVVDGYLHLGQDSDGDGLPDLLEEHYGLSKEDPNDAAGDLDGDGVSNLQAYQYGWSLVSQIEVYDADGDRIFDTVEDAWATAHPGSLNKNVFADAVADFDNDGVMNFEEIALGLNLAAASSARADGWADIQVLAWALQLGVLDTQGDLPARLWAALTPEWLEAAYGPNSMLHWLESGDLDNNGEADGLAAFRAEYQPPPPARQLAGDCDGDGMSDVWEYRHSLALRDATDAGSVDTLYTPAHLPVLMSFEEFAQGWTETLDITAEQGYALAVQSFEREVAGWQVIDPDGDGLGNLKEFQLGTHPRIADTDGDGISDLAEMQGGSDPTNIVSVPPPTTGGTSTGGGSTGGTSTGAGGTGTGSTGGGSTGGSSTPPEPDPEEPVMQHRSASASYTESFRYTTTISSKNYQGSWDLSALGSDPPEVPQFLGWSLVSESEPQTEEAGSDSTNGSVTDTDGHNGQSTSPEDTAGKFDARDPQTWHDGAGGPLVVGSSDGISDGTAPGGGGGEESDPPYPYFDEDGLPRAPEGDEINSTTKSVVEQNGEPPPTHGWNAAMRDLRLKRAPDTGTNRAVSRSFLKVRTENGGENGPQTTIEPVTLTIPVGEEYSESVTLRAKAAVGSGKSIEERLLPIQLLSRDKFFAGSFEIPQGWENLELEFAGPGGENLGRYGQLLGGGTTRIFSSVQEILDPEAVSAEQPANQRVWFVRDPFNSRKIDWYTCFNAVGDVTLKLHVNDSMGGIQHTLRAEENFAGWINYVDQWVKGTSFRWEVPMEQLPLPTQTLASVIAADPAAADAGMTALAAGNALLSGAVLTTETNVPLAPEPLTAALGEPVADLGELGSLAAVRVLPLETLNFQPALTLDPGTVYWLAGGTLRPLAQEQLETLLPQTGSVTLAAVPEAQAGANANEEEENTPETSGTAGKMDNLTRACLIPIFLVIGQVEGMEATASGVFEGFKAGLEDDYQLLALLKTGAVAAGDFIREQWAAEVSLCRTDREKRAEMLKALAAHVCKEFVFKPLQSLHEDLATWEGFKRRAFQLCELQNKVIDFHLQAFVVAKDKYPEAGEKIGNAITTWMDDFSDRILAGSEKTAFNSAPWHKDPLIHDLIGTGRHYAYGTGYAAGFIAEQALSGLVQGGVGKIATVMLKGGVKAGQAVIKRSAFAVAHQMHAVKQYLAGVWARSEMGFVQVSIGNAAKKPVSTALRTPAGDQMEKHLSKPIINRATWNHKTIRDLFDQSPNLKRLALEKGEEILWQRLALFTHLMGDLADETLMRNFLKVMDQKLIYDLGGQPVDWAEDFLRCFKRNPGEFVTPRNALSELPDNGKDFLKQFLSDPNAGDMWKLPDGPDVHEKYWIRGLVGELEMLHKQYAQAGYEHLPNATGIDFQNMAAQVTVQTKTVQTVNDGAITRMKNAIQSLIDNSPGDHQLVLEVLLKPGNSATGMKSTLQNFLNSPPLPGGNRVLLNIREHIFGQ